MYLYIYIYIYIRRPSWGLQACEVLSSSFPLLSSPGPSISLWQLTLFVHLAHRPCANFGKGSGEPSGHISIQRVC